MMQSSQRRLANYSVGSNGLPGTEAEMEDRSDYLPIWGPLYSLVFPIASPSSTHLVLGGSNYILPLEARHTFVTASLKSIGKN